MSADSVFEDLEDYAVSPSRSSLAVLRGEQAAPTRMYGTCRVANGEVRDSAERLVAKLHCGIELFVPGIHDPAGLEVGLMGARVIAAHEAGADTLVCVGGRKSTECRFRDVGQKVAPRMRYRVMGVPTDAVVTGTQAVAFFRDRRIAGIFVTVDCH